MEVASIKGNNHTRWVIVYVWITIFSVFNMFEWHNLRQNKASVVSLQKTNCKQKRFLAAARGARIEASKIDKDGALVADREAIRQYTILLNNYSEASTGRCEIRLNG